LKIKKGNKKLIRAWAFYDWANSAYALVISSAIFPIFFEKGNPNSGHGLLDHPLAFPLGLLIPV